MSISMSNGKYCVLMVVLMLQLQGYCQNFSDQLLLRLAPLSNEESSTLQTVGILEVQLQNTWYRFCGSGWGRSESYVACGQLGFSNVGDLSIEDERLSQRLNNREMKVIAVKCTGKESRLSECKYINTVNNVGSCPSQQSVVTACQQPMNVDQTSKSQEVTNRIRLRGGALTGEGRVQVLREGRWREICANVWNIQTSNVACRQLGFGTAKNFHLDNRFGRGERQGRKPLKNLNCDGYENSLEKCSLRSPSSLKFSALKCSKQEWISISCFVANQGYGNKIRLIDGPSKSIGRVVAKVGKDSSWGSICSDNWTLREASVVCRQLGLGYALKAIQNAWYFTSSRRHLSTPISNIACLGHERSLDECRYDVVVNNASTCGKGDGSTHVGVACDQTLPDLQLDVEALEGSFRLDIMALHDLECAASQNCLAPSADFITDRNAKRRLLRFTVSTWNRGTADYRPNLIPENWIWHKCHEHYHSVADFAHYELLSKDTHHKAASGQKASFCLENVNCEGGQQTQTYDCSKNEQGISVGCADIYYWNYDCQWIDITAVQPGNYYVRITLNPLETIAEMDISNNVAVCELTYTGIQVSVKNCHRTDDFAVSAI